MPILTFDSPWLYLVLGTWLCPLVIYVLSRFAPPPPPSEKQLRSLESWRRFARVMLYLTAILLPLSLIVNWLAGTLSWADDGPKYIVWITVLGVGWSTRKVLQDWYGRGQRTVSR